LAEITKLLCNLQCCLTYVQSLFYITLQGQDFSQSCKHDGLCLPGVRLPEKVFGIIQQING